MSFSRCCHEPFAACSILVLLACLAACGGGGEREITERRALSEADREVFLGATSAQRFGLERPPGEAAPAPAKNPFRYDKPENWEEIAATSMRVVNFRFGENGEGECYLSVLPGAAGGAASNINRWRGQMGLAPWSEEEIAALPTKMLLGQAAPFGAFDGTFSGMGQASGNENYRLLGAILSVEDFTLFVKMTGPADVVRREEGNFDAFCNSLRIVTPEERSN